MNIVEAITRPIRAVAWRIERDFFLPCKLPRVNWGVKYLLPTGKRYLGWFPLLRHRFYTRLYVSERVVEIPFLFRHIDLPRDSRILDFGCNESLSSLNLASLGYRVVGCDLHPYEFTHPNLEFVQGDFLSNSLSPSSFDMIVAISSVEHAGIKKYADFGKQDPRQLFLSTADREVMREFARLLVPQGRLIITVPYGKKASSHWMRSYDRESFVQLLSGFYIMESEYYRMVKESNWVPALEREMKDIDNLKGMVRGVVCAVCSKKHRA